MTLTILFIGSRDSVQGKVAARGDGEGEGGAVESKAAPWRRKYEEEPRLSTRRRFLVEKPSQ